MLASPSRSRRIRRADSASSTVARRMPTNAPAPAPDASSAHAPANLTANPAAHAGSRTPRPRPPEARIRGLRRSPRRAVRRPRERAASRHALTVCLVHHPKCLPLPAAAVSLRPVITGWRLRADAAARGSAGSARRDEPQQHAAAEEVRSSTVGRFGARRVLHCRPATSPATVVGLSERFGAATGRRCNR